jgi:hypothetical protein
MTDDLVILTTTEGGALVTAPDRITAVWQAQQYEPAVHPQAFPGKPPTEPRPARTTTYTRVELSDGAGAYAVQESPELVLARREAALRARRRGVGRVFRRARRVWASRRPATPREPANAARGTAGAAPGRYEDEVSA